MIKKFLTILYFVIAALLLLFVIIFSSCTNNNGNPTESTEPTETTTVEPTIKPSLPVETNVIGTQPIGTEPTEPAEPIESEEPPQLIAYYTEKDVIALAKVLYNECRGVPSDIEKACVGWTACNRVDAGFGDTIYEVLTAPNQFAYNKRSPVTEELYYLALDILERWNSEKNGFEDVGRVLPSNYLWFHGDGEHNYFRDKFDGDFNIWDYSLSNPYDN